MANEKTPVVWDDTTKKHRPLGTGEKMGGLDASSLLSSDSGNLITSGSDGLAYASGSGIADPAANNLIETSDQGRLIVTADRIAEWIRLHPSDAADLAASLAPGLSTELADGKTIVASGGKLTVDPTNATPAQKKKINQALADADSGLVVDNSTGKLQVDFSNMPTDKFEDLLKGLKMTVPLDSNKALYVSVNNANAVEPSYIGGKVVYPDGCGTAAKPFKKIQDCVNYATSTYAVGGFHIDIRVVAGTYNENVSLPDFSHGTGYIRILSDSGARDVIVVAQPTGQNIPGFCFTASGGSWVIVNVDARRTERPNSGTGGVGGCFASAGGGTSLRLYGCSASQTMPSGNMGGNPYDIRLLHADSDGRLVLAPGTLAGSISTQQPADGTTPAVNVLVASRGGTILLMRNSDSSLSHEIACSGSCNVFLDMWQAGAVNTSGVGPLVYFVDNGMDGQRFRLRGGSYVAGLGSNATYFPGDSSPADAIEAATYCWYA